MPFTRLLRQGLVAGAAAGLAAALVLVLVVEPVIRRALLIEDARADHAHDGGAAHDHTHEELVSRTTQEVAGALTAVVVGVLVGLVFAVVFARLRHRLPGSTDVGRSMALAGAGFLALVVLPAVKVPANPPAVGDPETVTYRTLLYLVVVVLGLLAATLVTAADRWLAGRGTAPGQRAALNTLVAVAAAVALLALVPGASVAVPDDVPATLLWDFRVASLAQLAAMWLTLGLTMGVLVDRAVRRDRGAAPVTV